MLHDEQTAQAGEAIAVAAMASRMAGRMAGRECLMIEGSMLEAGRPRPYVPGSAGVSPALRSPQQGAGGTPALPVKRRKGRRFPGFFEFGSLPSKPIPLPNSPVPPSPV